MIRGFVGKVTAAAAILSFQAFAATLHVWLESPDPTPPYSSWETAARVLQDAVDSATTGDTVLVTNGVYSTGGRRIEGLVTNRVAIPSGVIVQSVGGPLVTFIEGAATPSAPGVPNKTGNGDGAVRCAYLGSNAVLAGFTLRNGHTRTNGLYDWDQSGGGAWCERGALLQKCHLTNNFAHHMGGGAYGGVLSQSRAVANVARYGGAACLADVFDSFVGGNSAENGGGTYMSRVERSLLSTNNANVGGGAMGGTLAACTLVGNVAGQWGGGVSQASLDHCRIEDNIADRGGGAFVSTLFGCVVTGNTADLGGGAAGGTLRQCTVTGNVGGSGGGVYLSSVHHSIVYFNDAVFGPNHDGATLTRSCTTPLPEGDTSNFSEDPLLATTSHLSAESPCRTGGSENPSLPTDSDGDPWLPVPSIGSDQFAPGQAGGTLTVPSLRAPSVVARNHAVRWRADAAGRTTSSRWDFGDGTVILNHPWPRHAWTEPGEYVVTLTVYNETHTIGVSSSVTVRVIEPPVLHVAPTSPRPTPPFATWDTAALTVQAAIDAATVPGSLVLVTNGFYSRGSGVISGDVLQNRVALTKPIHVRSVNGPAFTHLVGEGPLSDFAVRCAFVGRDARLSGFTLTNGYTRTLGARPREQRGAGVASEAGGVVSNCVLVGNLARQYGGGANRATLVQCRLVGNRALDGAGGAHESHLDGCVLEGNTAVNTGGGVSRSDLVQCVLVGNSAPQGAASYYGTLARCRLERNVTDGDGYGGAAHGGTLTDSLLLSNVAFVGGGAFLASLVRCRIEANEARREGGGAASSTLTDCVVVSNSASYGGGASSSQSTRCEFSRNTATIAGGAADGGEFDECDVSENSAFYGGASQNAVFRRSTLRGNSAVFGGAGYRDLHFNGLFTGNVATNQGGAAFQSQLFHCTVTGNQADVAGGTFEGTNRNAIVYFNSARTHPDQKGSVLVTSCTSPAPDLLPGSITEPPRFRLPSAGDYRLRAGSPCIDAGSDLRQYVADDLDGIPRPLDGNADGKHEFDIGAFEYDVASADSDFDGVPDAWYRAHGLDPGEPGAAIADPDGDRHSNFQEWVAGTLPDDRGSAFEIIDLVTDPQVTLSVNGLVGREYTLLFADGFDSADSRSVTWTAVPGQVRVPGVGGRLRLSDTNAAGQRYYRVTVDLPDVESLAVAGARSGNLAPWKGPGPASRDVGTSRLPSIASNLLANRTTAEVGSHRRPAIESGQQATSNTRNPLVDPHAAFSLSGATSPTPAEGEYGDRGLLDLGPVLAPSVPSSEATAFSPTAPPQRRVGLHATTRPVVLHRVRIPFGEGVPISPMLRGQEPFMLYAESARKPTLELGRGASYRGVAGGTDAETYNWKDLSASTRPHAWSYHADDPPVVTTLEWLEQARDFDAELVLTVNTRGHGRTVINARGRRTWSIEPAFNSPDYVAGLAADWVRYVNQIAPRYRLTPEGLLPRDLVASDPDAHRILEELKAFGNGTNAWTYRLAAETAPDIEIDPVFERPFLLPHDAPAPTRKVTYWEIGNEVETPMSISDPRGERLMEPGINLTPGQYVERYLRITAAMKQVDPTILVGPCPNNPWGPKVGIENEHLVQLLARKDAVIDLLYFHYYHIWVGNYFRPADVSRNLRALKNYAYQLAHQYTAHFARAGRPVVPFIISEWNPDYSIHPPVEREMLSALATAEVFLTFVELQALGAHYWENPDGRASEFVFEKLQTHLGDRYLGTAYGELQDDGSYVGFGAHPSASTDVRIYATRRSSDSRVFLWLMNLSDTVPHTIEWTHPRSLRDARLHTLGNPRGQTTFYTPVAQMEWTSQPLDPPLSSSSLPPGSLAILELTYDGADDEPLPPVISALSDTRAPKDTEIVVTGKGFAPRPEDNVVHVGFGHAPVIAATASELRIRIPASATYGPVTVTTRGRTASSREYFSLAAFPGNNRPVDPELFVPLRQRLYPPEGAPIVTAPVQLQLADWQNGGLLQLVGITARAGSVLPHTIDLYVNDSVPGELRLSTPSCTPQAPRCSLPLNSSPARMAIGDLDGDGFLDLACADRHAWHVAAWRNVHPSTNHSFDVIGLLPTGRSPSSVAIHDLDLDARPDLVAANGGDDSISVIPNETTGPGLPVLGTHRLLRAASAGTMLGPHAIAVGDVVGDSRPDIIVASRSAPGLTVFENSGSPGRMDFSPSVSIPAAGVESLALGDVDGDGRLDILVSGTWPLGGITIWRNDGSNHFLPTSFATSRDPRQLGVGDINGDGLPEVLTVNNDTVSVSVFRNRSEPGNVAFDERVDFPLPGVLPNDPICMAVGDMDGDGHSDVAVGHYYSGLVTFLRNRGLHP